MRIEAGTVREFWNTGHKEKCPEFGVYLKTMILILLGIRVKLSYFMEKNPH
jgi:hypothetical protein